MAVETIVNWLRKSVGHFTAGKRAGAERPSDNVVPSRSCLRAGQTAAVTLEGSTLDGPGEGTLLATIREVTRKTLTLTLERDPLRRRQIGPETGQTVTLTIAGEGGLYRFTGSVRAAHSLEKRPGTRLLEVELPFWLLSIQRREYVRVPLRAAVALENDDALLVAPATVSVSPQKPEATPRLPLQGALVDLSGGGLRAEVQGVFGANEAAQLVETLAPGTTLRVRLSLPGLHETPLTARVRKIERIVVRGGLSVRLACEFLPLATWERDLVIHHVFAAQREELHTRRNASAPAIPIAARA